MKRLQKNILIAALLVLPALAVAQTGGIVVIQHGFDPVLTDAFKLNTKAQIVDTVSIKPMVSYSIESVLFETKYTPMPIGAAKISGEPIVRLYRNLIKVGMGNYTTPYVELFVNNTRASNYSIGFHVKQLSSNGKIKDFASPRYANTDFELYGKRIYNRYTLESAVEYNRNMNQYYGYKPKEFPTVNLSESDLRHLVNIVTFDTKLSSNNSQLTALKNDYRIKYHYLQDNNKNSESALLVSSNMSKRVKWMKFTDFQTIGGELSLDYLNNKWDTLRLRDYALIKFKPYFSTTFKEYEFKIGANAVVQTETASSGNFFAFPFAEARFTIIPKIMTIHAGITGDVERVSYRKTMLENPFLGNDFNTSFQNTNYKFYGGFESNLSSSLQLNISGDASKVENMLFYVTDTANILKNTFTTVTDDVQLFHLRADLTYRNAEKLWVVLSTNYFQYTMLKQLEAWNKPVLEVSLMTNYNIQDKFIIQANIFVLNGIISRDVEAGKIVSKSLNPALDFNLGLEYRYTKNLGAFLNVNNIAGMRNYHYLNYPSQRFNFMLGISYSFGGNQPTKKAKKAE